MLVYQRVSHPAHLKPKKAELAVRGSTITSLTEGFKVLIKPIHSPPNHGLVNVSQILQISIATSISVHIYIYSSGIVPLLHKYCLPHTYMRVYINVCTISTHLWTINSFTITIIIYYYIYIYMSSRQNTLHLSSWYCYGYRFPGFCGNQHIDAYWRSNMKPESTSKRARKWIEELFCRFQVLRQHFMFLSFCIHLHASSFTFLSLACIFLSFCIHFLSFSFHSPFMFLSFVFMSLHFPFIFFSCSFQCAFMSFHFSFICMHFPFILHSCPFISFHF